MTLRKTPILCTLAIALFFVSGPAMAQVKRKHKAGSVEDQQHQKQLRNAMCAKINKDPLWLKYYAPKERTSNMCHPDRWLWPGFKEAVLMKQKNECSWAMENCKFGWNQFMGKKVPAVIGPYLKDALAFDLWDGINPGGNSAKINWGAGYFFKVGEFGSNSRRKAALKAAVSLAYFKQPGAADALAKTIAGPKEQQELWWCSSSNAYRGLWLLGGKAHLKTILDGLERRFVKRWVPKGMCSREHVHTMLPLLASWKLTPVQNKRIENFCAETIFGSEEKHAKHACLRYLGRIATKHGDARDYIANFVTSDNRWFLTSAIRAAGQAKIKELKGALIKRLARQYLPKTHSVKKGKKYVRVKTDFWQTGFRVVPTAVALIGMGDKTALKAAKFWLGTENRKGQIRLTWSQGFTELAKETAFANSAALKKLKPLLAKTLKTILKGAATNRGLERPAYVAAIYMSQIGDPTALKHLISLIKGGDRNQIIRIMAGWGGEPGRILRMGRDSPGLARFPVGKGGYSVKQAQQVITLIKKRLKFWSDTNVKTRAIEAALNIQARIDIVKNKL
jgi:hypothetical protein